MAGSRASHGRREEPAEPAASLLERAGAAAGGISSIGAGNPRRRALLQYGVAALIFGFLVFFVARQWNKLPDFDWRFAPAWLALSLGCIVLFYAAQGELWRVVLRSLGEQIDAVPGRAVWGKSLIARYVPTNALMVVGRVIMAERYGVKKRVCLASIVYELGLSFGTAVMVGAYFVIQLPSLEDQPSRYVVLVLIPMVLAGLHPRVFFPLANFALRKLGREPLPRPLGFLRVLELAAGYIVSWAIIGLGTFAFAAAVQPLDASDLLYVAAAYPVAFCVAVLTFIVPSGLGTRDAALATAMAAVMDATVATAIAVGFRIFQTLVELGYVGAVAGIERRASGRDPAAEAR